MFFVLDILLTLAALNDGRPFIEQSNAFLSVKVSKVR